jgi:plastocyanin
MPRLALLVPVAVVIAAACADSSASRSVEPSSVASFSSGSGSSGSGNARIQVLQMRDDCDSTSFNANIGAGTCVRRGSVTFDRFIADLTKDRFVGAWKNNPDQFNGKPGTSIDVTNIGGETHTFTRVASFGGGIVPLLNDLSGNTTVAAECADLDPSTIVPAGGHMHGTALAAGTYRFQCCIHPWMRSTATLRS